MTRHPKELLTVNGAPAWAVVVDELDYAVLHTIRYEDALDNEWHHTFYTPPHVAYRLNKGEARVVWVDRNGLRTMEPMPAAMASVLRNTLRREEL